MPLTLRLGLAVLLIVSAPFQARQRPQSGEMTAGATLQYVAHASFVVRSPGGVVLLLDPYAGKVWLGYDFPGGIDPDAVVITHPHYDHDAGRFRGAPFPWGPEVTVVDAPGVRRIGDVRVTGIRGKHADPYGKEFGQLNTLMVLEVAGVRIAHLGDNGPLTDDNLEALGRVDVLMVPVDGEEHIITHAEVARVVGRLSPSVVIPMHYRIPELEADADSPSDLGDIEGWLAGRTGVVRVDGNTIGLSKAALPSDRETWVFHPSPDIARPMR